jgi:hypothetical protein
MERRGFTAELANHKAWINRIGWSISLSYTEALGVSECFKQV